MRLFVDNLTNVDFSFLDARRGLVGETWLANIRLEGALDEQGMVCDFGTVKKTVRQWLDTELDHRLAIPTQSPNLTLEENGEELTVHWQLDSGGQILTSGPRQAFALVDAEQIDTEGTARWVEQQLESAFPQEFEALLLGFDTEAIDGPYYHYSHGLKKHAGNCQRIAHGHRSRIDIWADGEKNTEQEKLWAERWRDIYIGTREDITAEPDIDGIAYIDFAYRADQGDFYLRLPRTSCYLIDTDSTVECLATHIAERTARENPGRQWRIRAFEGANKGAEAEASQ